MNIPLRRPFARIKRHLDFNSLSADTQHSLAVKLLTACFENDVVNPQLVRSFSDDFDEFICSHLSGRQVSFAMWQA